jgi:NCAIR mutase (PurE)-related protein
VGQHIEDQLETFLEALCESPFTPGSAGNVRDTGQGNGEGELQSSLAGTRSGSTPAIDIRPDPGREQRKGAPEVIFGETKEVSQIISMARILLESTGRAIVSRVRSEAAGALREAFPNDVVRVWEVARAVTIYRPEYVPRRTGGHVGIISAGTSDIPVAEEAALIVREMGCEVTSIYDVGVAGLHRLLTPLRDLFARGTDAIIVAAGMDGALPSVVAGLAPVPVIGWLWPWRQGHCRIAGDVTNVRAWSRRCQYR